MRLLLLFLCALLFSAQTAKRPFQAQSASSIQYTIDKDAETVQITNVTYQVVDTPALDLRKTTSRIHTLGDIPEEGVVTYEAWPVGKPLEQRPSYAFTVKGFDGEVHNNDLLVVEHGVDPTWWTVRSLANGRQLFDTFVPLVSIEPRDGNPGARYAGLEVPPDDATDSRLREPRVVAVITYASPEKVLREALLTCDDPKRAAELRNYSDEERKLSVAGGSARTLKLSFRSNPPDPPRPVEVLIPIVKDDLDLARAQVPPRLHLARWTR